MTAFAACLFALAALVSAWTIVASWRRYGASAMALKAQLKACPEDMVIHWTTTERRALPVLVSLRKGRAAYPAHRSAPGLEWPGLNQPGVALAA